MIICVGIGAITLAGCWFVRKKDAVYRKMLLCVAVSAILGAFLQMQENEGLENGAIMRNDAGKGEKQAEVILDVPELETEYEMTVAIPEQNLTQKEAKDLLNEAQKEAETVFLGENTSLDEVSKNVVVKETYQNGLVSAEWSFDQYDVVEPDGTVKTENLTEEGCLVKADCELRYKTYQSSVSFYFKAVLPEQTRSEQVLAKVKKKLQQEAEETTETFQLPQKADGYALVWSEKKNPASYQLIGLGIVLAIGIKISETQKERKKAQHRKMLLTLEYPEIVNKLSLLLGAGMTLNYAWKRIATKYDNERKKNGFVMKPAYEEMLVVCREMESGVGEKTAYEHFGERCGTRRYRKLATLLMQNAKKGTRGLSVLLEQESEDAFDERKNMAKKYAQEAGTKLLFPMIVMLGIVIVILIVPAMAAFQM